MDDSRPHPPTAEHARLAEATGRAETDLFSANPWYEWGPYLSERAWGTVREDYSADGDAWRSFPHDHARSRAYRWNEDGMAGISDLHHELCLGLALWNGRDPILKERMFGLAGPEGNHGEDAKEYWWYLEGLPSHALLHWRYHYPQDEFPYGALTHHGRGLQDPELELLDTGVFDDDRYWSVDVTYAKATPTEVLMRVVVENHGPDEATLDVLPTLWFRNTWSWDEGAPAAAHRGRRHRAAGHRPRPGRLPAGCRSRARRPGRRGALLRERHQPATPVRGACEHPVPQGRHQRPRGLRCRHGQPGRVRHQGGAAVPGHRSCRRHRRAAAAPAPPGCRAAGGTGLGGIRIRRRRHHPRARGRRVLRPPGPRRARPRSSCGCCARRAPGWCGASRSTPTTWAAGSTATPGSHRRPSPGAAVRNDAWRHLDSFDVLAMPDPWEYPWFAAWDLGFHAVAWAHLDPAFAKYQTLVLLREWFQHPNGALPAYEWNFDDVNPPVHVLAALRVYRIDGSRDREFLERVFQKLLVNFTWWLNRQDADGNNVFGGGFLGLDNISPIDRSKLPDGIRLEQADGTAWMAYYAMSMLVIAVELAQENPVYDDMVVKFLEQFLQIRRALEDQGLYDEADAFFYDRLVHPTGDSAPVQVRTISGLIPLLPAVGLPRPQAAYVDRLGKGFANVRESWARHGGTLAGLVRELDGRENILVSVLHPDDVRLALKEFFDEDAFLSPHGLRSVSKRYEGHPYSIPGMPGATIDYEPAESTTAMFGGNSNWRGPVWMPLNYLAVRQFGVWQRFLGDDFTLEYPTGSGVQHTFGEIAQDLADRLVAIWLPDARGRRPVFGAVQRLQEDPAWKDNLLFFEYFHGDNGAGLGAIHQTGWTALVVDLLLDPPGRAAR